MSRRAFSDDDFSESSTLQNVSANLQTIKRMMGWGTTEMSKQVGISDRHLDSLLRMTSNVTVLVLEKIAEGLGIPFQRLTGTRIVVKGHKAGADFLEELQQETWHISSKDFEAPIARSSREAPSRKVKKDTKAVGEPTLPPGMEGIFQRLVDVQERLTKDQSRTDVKINKLAEQVQELASAVRGKPTSSATRTAEASGSGRSGKRSGKATAASWEGSSRTSKGWRSGSDGSSAGSGSEGDLFDRIAPEAKSRHGRRPAVESTTQTRREAALKPRGHASVKKAKATKDPGVTKRLYNKKK
jgi:transcriptional regulator with XRE-family HTH domain